MRIAAGVLIIIVSIFDLFGGFGYAILGGLACISHRVFCSGG